MEKAIARIDVSDHLTEFFNIIGNKIFNFLRVVPLIVYFASFMQWVYPLITTFHAFFDLVPGLQKLYPGLWS